MAILALISHISLNTLNQYLIMDSLEKACWKLQDAYITSNIWASFEQDINKIIFDDKIIFDVKIIFDDKIIFLSILVVW